MNTLKSTLILLASLWLISCNSAQKAFNNGDYEEAVRLSIQKLRDKPNDKKARTLLVDSYQKAVDANLSTIEAYERIEDPLRWEPIVRAYNRLNLLHQRLDRCPVCDDLLPSRNLYIDEWNVARLNAAEVRYQMGMSELSGSTRQSAKQAMEHFMQAEQFEPDYKDVRQQMEVALNRATLHVVIRNMPVQQRSYEGIQTEFEQKLIEVVSNRTANRYVRFYSEEEVSRQRPEFIDHHIDMTFESFRVGNMLMESNTTELTSKDSVKIGDARVGGETIPVYGTVSAKFTAYAKTIMGDGQLLFVISDAETGRIILQQRFVGEYQWRHEWASFNGDERALSPKQKELAALRDMPPPPDTHIFEEFTLPIFQNVSDRIRRFYAQY
jgi:tetratricopeptide (TPR) repeat protein